MAGAHLAGKWFILYTRNKKEAEVRQRLPFESIVPMMERRKTKRVRGSDDQSISYVALEPKYPNYVFVKHDGSDVFFRTCIEDNDVLMFAGGVFDEMNDVYPAPVSSSEEARIFEKELMRNLEVGGAVSIIDGPFAGWKGEIVQRLGGTCVVNFKIWDIKMCESIPEEFLIANE